jgi:hypothetical protein
MEMSTLQLSARAHGGGWAKAPELVAASASSD